MNLQSKFIAVVILAGALIGTVNFSTIAFAEKPTDPNCFGDSASDLAQSEEGMGEHSKEGSVAGDAPFDSDGPEVDEDKPGRQGIGNVGDDEENNIHPSDLADALGGECDEEED